MPGLLASEPGDQFVQALKELVGLQVQSGKGSDGGSDFAMAAAARIPRPGLSPAAKAIRAPDGGITSNQSPLGLEGWYWCAVSTAVCAGTSGGRRLSRRS
ncbi:hypothetical protein [Streptomyces sp. NPDC048357]|uniref:hypothetical protein n=1 Tax=Streptomyces sp. NPDC048357 TaxID=3154719 RepID=UPI00344976C0